ncbi:MAG: DUF1232 domain-containing protein [Chloroflexi bacterium]|nr:DUF1232 domain-containing protein [Chloroflexota bacterium]
MGWLASWRDRADVLRAETLALYLAVRDRRTPWYAKALAALVVLYAVSPIDLIPDFIPFLGSLDDLILVPLGIIVAIKLVPEPVMADCRMRAAHMSMQMGKTKAVAALVVLVWLALAALTIWLVWRALR